MSLATPADPKAYQRPFRTPATGTGDRPSTLRFEHKRHMYFDGHTWLPSVTGITGKAEDKSGLLNWVARETATCAIEEAAELSRIRRLQDDDAAHEWLSGAADRKRDKATVSGSDLHDVADRMLCGMDMPEHLHDDVKAMAKHVLAFMRDYRVQVLHSEVRLAHRTLGYCGTTDQIGIVPQYGTLPVIIDWKTSASMYKTPKFSHGKNAMQLAPYSRAEVMFWDDKSESDMIRVSQEVGLIVMIRPEGYKVYDYDLVRAWPQFERAFASYHWWRDVDELSRGPVRPWRAAPVEPVGDPVNGLVALDKAEHERDNWRALLLAQIESAGNATALVELHAQCQANSPELWTDAHSAAANERIAQLGTVSAA